MAKSGLGNSVTGYKIREVKVKDATHGIVKATFTFNDQEDDNSPFPFIKKNSKWKADLVFEPEASKTETKRAALRAAYINVVANAAV